jgi:cyclophilin family peptidyl-prolyl cis-trans isomerase
MNIRLWAVLAALLLALGGASWWLSRQQTRPERVSIKPPANLDEIANPKPVKLKTATLEPGRVVVLNTNCGKIEFVLYEKDCPMTTARIARLVQSGAYNGVRFPRAENWVIQTDPAKEEVGSMGIEIAKGLLFDVGCVGMARATGDVNTNTSVFYVLLKPSHNLDLKYTNFGRVINGMDVARRIAVGDQITTATVRPFSADDRKRLDGILKVTATRGSP